MASVVTLKSGERRVQFKGLDGKRRTIYLGKCSKRFVDKLASHVEFILASSAAGEALPVKTVDFLDELTDVYHSKLAAAGLVNPRAVVAKPSQFLGPFLAEYIGGRTDVKTRTGMKYESTRRTLVEFFGADKPLDSITPGDVDAYRRWLAKGKKNARAENTVRKHIGTAKVFFNGARRLRLIAEDPFADQKATIQPNAKRMQFITPEDIAKVKEACPDAYWRLVVALARYGGLRIPSELGIVWDDVDWSKGRLRIRSPKTAHHHGKDERIIPLFPELQTALSDVWDLTPPGTVFVLPDAFRQRENLRKRMLEIIRKAGLTPWPKVFQNLRSSRETELAGQHPLHVVTAWLGNSQRVAMRHYLTVTDADYSAALAPSEATQNPTHSVPEQGCMETNANPLQQKTPAIAGVSEHRVAVEGLEKPAISRQKTLMRPADNAFSNASGAPAAVLTDAERRLGEPVSDPLLARFLAVWDRLSAPERLVIVAEAERRVDELGDADIVAG